MLVPWSLLAGCPELGQRERLLQVLNFAALDCLDVMPGGGPSPSVAFLLCSIPPITATGTNLATPSKASLMLLSYTSCSFSFIS